MNIDINYAKGLVQNYGQNQWQIINVINKAFGPGIKDSRSVWISLDDLQNFIQQIQQPNPAGVGPATGVRIYFGTYSATCPSPIQPDVNGLHTLLMIPTINDAVTGLN